MTLQTERPRAQAADPENLERRIGLLRLFIGLLLILGLAGLFGVLGATLVILGVLGIIVFHEFGHFATAKLTGMQVTEFFVGFGPRLWSVRKGETEYGVKALPLGGYCKIPGMTLLEEVDPADEPRSYRQQRFWKRFLVVFAGPSSHFILGFLLLYAGLATGAYAPFGEKPLPVVDELSAIGEELSPAARAGFRPGDRVVAVDGQLVEEWDEVKSYTAARPGQPIDFVVERGGRRMTLTATPVDARKIEIDGTSYADPAGPAVGLIGITAAWPEYNAVTAIPKAGQQLGFLTGETVSALGDLVDPDGIRGYFEQLGGRESRPDDLRFLSPVGLANVAGEAAQSGVGTVLTLLILINVFVGLFNLVPLLPLDGGHIAIALYEAIRARPGRRYHADVRKLQPVLIATLVLLAFLALTALWLDVVQPAQIQ